MGMTRVKLGAAAGLVMLLAACGGTDGSEQQGAGATEPVQQTQTQAPTSEEPSTEEETSEEPTAEEGTSEEPTTEEPEPTRDGPDTYQVGELIERPTANLIVNVLEERDAIPASSSFHYTSGQIERGEGERLWYVDITWTNNLPEAVGKECHGPYAMQLRAFDLQGREMLMAEQPGMIEGQECSTGLMQGQTGRWQSAFHGLDQEFGWLVFEDYNGEPAAVVLDPDLELSYNER